ncbi:MAG TPA: GNAT family N-acetyltransferase, partial [Gammaproteobacteria bacterium]|nr:GNAT family N-acetyltransferase [Gammaproteobacteria bacterium]
MNIVACDYETHAAPILAILNDAIVTSTALFDYRPREPASMLDWFRAKDARRFP